MPTAQTVRVPSPQAPSPPAPSPPLPEDGQPCPETAEAVARANEAGGLDENDDDAGLSTPKQVMTPRDLAAANETPAVPTEDDEDNGGQEGYYSDNESWTPTIDALRRSICKRPRH